MTLRSAILVAFLAVPIAAADAAGERAQGSSAMLRPLVARDLPVSGPGGLALDAQGTAYVAATLFSREPISFDGHVLATTGDGDVFVAAYDGDGRVRWARNLGDAAGNPQYATGAAVTSTGTLAVIGNFSGSLEIGPKKIESAAPIDFLAGFDATTGAGKWALRFDDGPGGALNAVAADPAGKDGRIAVCGRAGGAAQELVPGARFGGGKSDAVIALFDSSGKRRWSRQLGGAGEEECHAVALGDDGDVYAAGRYNDDLSLSGPLPKPDAGGHRWIWLARFDGRTGAVKAQTSFAATLAMPGALAVAGDRVAVGGSFLGHLDFPAAAPLLSAGGSDAFVAVLALQGKSFVPRWAVRMGAQGPDVTKGLAYTSKGEVIATGQFCGKTTGVATLTAGGEELAADLFVLMLDGESGTARYAASYGDQLTQSGDAVVVNRSGKGALKDRFAVAGTLDGAMDFPPPIGLVRAALIGDVVLLLGDVK